MTDTTRIPTRSARLLRPAFGLDLPETGIDGEPVDRKATLAHRLEHLGLAMAQLEGSRLSARKARVSLSEAGQHAGAQELTEILDAIDALRSRLVREEL